MTIKSFTFNPFMTNSYVCHSAGEAVLVDASSHTRQEHQAVLDYLEKHSLTVRHLLLTHAHVDHIFGCAFFADRFGLDFQLHRADAPFLERGKEQAMAFGVQLQETPTPGSFLGEGDTVSFGEVTLEVLHTPGHSPGSISFVHRSGQAALTGDVLFQGSIGRVEGLPQTSYPQLIQSIRTRLLPLGDDTRIYPGHGPETSIGHERRSNPFLQEIVED